MARESLRSATVADLDVLVRHRRRMFEEMSAYDPEELDSLDVVYRRWARTRLRSGRLVGFIVETAREEVAASGCLWLTPSQPRPQWKGLTVPYLMSMYTEPEHRGKGYASRIVDEAIRWSRANGYNRIVLHASDLGRPVYERAGFERTHEMRLNLDRPSEAGSDTGKRPSSRRRRPSR